MYEWPTFRFIIEHIPNWKLNRAKHPHLTAEEKIIMQCPNCAIPLMMTERKGIEIDFCTQCRGVWLDRGELDKIIEVSLSEVPDSSPEPERRTESYRAAKSDKSRQYVAERRDRDRDRYRDRYRDDDRDRGRYRHKKPKSTLHQLFDLFD